MKVKYVIAILCLFTIIISASSFVSYGGNDKDKDTCFDFVYPISYIMPDRAIITVENEDDWYEIKNWYEENPDVKEEPQLQYPVEIIFKDGTIKTINNKEEMKKAYEYCRGDKDNDKDKYKCFKFVYPITYIMPDGSTIIVNDKEEWEDIKAWYEENPDVKEEPQLQYPVEIIFKDGTIKTINNKEEMKKTYEYCWGDKDGDKDDDKDDDKDRKLKKALGWNRNRLRDRIWIFFKILRARLFESLYR
jgi:hypothetical protein